MVGRVPLCVHGAGETKTGAGGRGGRGTVCSVTWGRPHPSTLPPLPGAAVRSSTEGLEGNCKQSGEGITRPGVWPHASEAMKSPALAWKGRKEVWRRKGPKQWGQFSTPQSPFPQPPCQPIYLFVFPLISRWEARQLRPKGCCLPSLDHCLLPPSLKSPSSLVLRTGAGVRWA